LNYVIQAYLEVRDVHSKMNIFIIVDFRVNQQFSSTYVCRQCQLLLDTKVARFAAVCNRSENQFLLLNGISQIATSMLIVSLELSCECEDDMDQRQSFMTVSFCTVRTNRLNGPTIELYHQCFCLHCCVLIVYLIVYPLKHAGISRLKIFSKNRRMFGLISLHHSTRPNMRAP